MNKYSTNVSVDNGFDAAYTDTDMFGQSTYTLA